MSKSPEIAVANSRRSVLFNAAAVAAGGIAAASGNAAHAQNASQPKAGGAQHGNMITMKDGAQIYFKEWGTGANTVVFSHGWPLNSDAWEDQMMFLAANGLRCIAHDRRGHGRSSQPWDGNDMDTYADDLATVVNTLNVRNAMLVGHSTGGGEVARYIGRHGQSRVSKAVLIGSVTPLMLKTASNPEGAPISVFDGIRKGVQADRAQFFKDLTTPFFGFNRTGVKDSQGLRDTFLMQGLMTGLRGAYECIKQFSETDFTQDLRKITVPTLIVHGDDDQIVPITASAIAASKILKNSRLEIYKGAPHAIPQMNKDKLNADLLAFARQA